uniref:C2H2-type domain-containing protein n=1 Tax=Calidris pygmaea TaxID=425635 RepID=A0A8C3JE11_9CHAR
MVAMEVGSPPLPKKSAPPGQLDPPPTRIGTKLSPEPPGSKPEPQDSKSQNLTTCEVCGACFETRKGLSSHARSHLRQLGVAESESSGAPIDLLYELMKQKGKPDGGPLSPPLGKKTGSPKDAAGSPRPTLLGLGKAGDRSSDGPVNKAIKSPPGFSKNLSQPGSPILKKVPAALSGSPSPKNPEEKSSKLSLSPLQSSPKAQWPQADEEGPLNLSEQGFLLGFWGKMLVFCFLTPLRLFSLLFSPPSDPPDGARWLWPAIAHSLLPFPASDALGETLPRPSLSPTSVGDLFPPRIPTAGDFLSLQASGSEPVRDIRCEFCGEFFENRKGLSSHARSHLRQMGVTEWYVNGSPIDTLREILKRRTQPRSGTSNPGAPGPKSMAKSLLGTIGSLEPRGPGEIHIPTLPKKVQQPGSPMGQSPTSSPPPTARKMFPGLSSPPSLQKKLKQDQLRLEIKREMMAGGLHGEPHPSEQAWPPREEMSPLNLCKSLGVTFPPSISGANGDDVPSGTGTRGSILVWEGAEGSPWGSRGDPVPSELGTWGSLFLWVSLGTEWDRVSSGMGTWGGSLLLWVSLGAKWGPCSVGDGDMGGPSCSGSPWGLSGTVFSWGRGNGGVPLALGGG